MNMDMGMEVGTSIHGFTVTHVEEVPDFGGVAYVMAHERSGAEVLFMANDDIEKAFAIGFKTLPTDDTGVFHVIEHSVLCGSQKFPVKDPFVQLLKTSMKTFLNAATGPDYTIYPVASTNEKDLFNLADVYMDAVFHPVAVNDEAVFLQEAWHYELRGDSVATTGVVLNEMRGATSPESQLGLELKRALYAGTPYQYQSGGVPQTIEELDYPQFLDAYHRHYRPDNCRVTVYGNVDMNRMLSFLDERLPSAAGSQQGIVGQCSTDDTKSHSTANDGKRLLGSDADSHQAGGVGMMLQCVQNTDIEVVADIPSERAMCEYSSIVAAPGDADAAIANLALWSALTDSSDAPITRRLQEAGLCREVVGIVSPASLYPTLTLAMLGIEPGSGAACLEALRKAVREILDEGIDPDLMEASITQIEFRLRGHEFGGTPDGIMFVKDSMPGWLHFPERPTGYTQYDHYIDFLHGKLGTSYFDELLEQAFFGNDHVVFGELVPKDDDQVAGETVPGELGPNEAKPIDGGLPGHDPNGEAHDDAISAPASDAIAQAHRAAELISAREELLASAPMDVLPSLSRDDLGAAPEMAPPVVSCEDGRTYLVHRFDGNGIVYVNRCFDITHLPAKELANLAVLLELLGELGTQTHDSEELNRVLKKNLGEFQADMLALHEYGTDDLRVGFVVSASMLQSKMDTAVEAANDVLYRTRFDDVARLRLTVMRVVQLQGMMLSIARANIPMVESFASSHLNATARVTDTCNGVEYFRFMQDLLKQLEDDEFARGYLEHLGELAHTVLRECPEITCFVGTEDDLACYRALDAEWNSYRREQPNWVAASEVASRGGDRVSDEVDEPGEALPGAALHGQMLGDIQPLQQSNKALVLPVDVATNVAVTSIGDMNVAERGAALLANRIVNLNYLWSEVREKGGAYGARITSNRIGDVTFLSHDDPNVDATFAAFAKAGEWLECNDLSEADFEGAVISTIAQLDNPRKPKVKAMQEMRSYLSAVPWSYEREARQAVLDCTLDDIRAYGARLRRAMDNPMLCAGAGEPLLEASSLSFEREPLFAE